MSKQLIVALIVGLTSCQNPAVAQAPGDTCVDISIEDKTGEGSPLSLSGSLTLCEREEQNLLLFWHRGEVRLQNKGTKGVSAKVVVVEFQYPHGEKESWRLLSDNFLDDGSMVSGESESHNRQSGVTRIPMPKLAGGSASVVGKVTFVQFEDGKYFGEPVLAADLIGIRALRLHALRTAEGAYTRGGEKALLEALESSARPEVDMYLGRFRHIHKRDGTDQALKSIRKVLAKAQSRSEALNILGR